MIGYAFCGSFCTHSVSLKVLEELIKKGEDVLPIMSETAYTTDTRFGTAEKLRIDVEKLCGKKIIHTLREAEPLGPKIALEAMIICPCTGNTLAKLSRGITDTAVCMAAKAHMRNTRPLLIALASNDAMSANLSSLAVMLQRRNVFFVPMKQDDPIDKPHSLVADIASLPNCLEAMRNGKQIRPLFL